MKLQRQKTHKVGDKQYYKYAIIVPENLVKTLDWREGDELDVGVKEKRLVVWRD